MNLKKIIQFFLPNKKEVKTTEKQTVPESRLNKPAKVKRVSRKGKTKTSEVLSHLLQNNSITSWQAIELYGATRLSAIIYNLRKRGYEIDTINRCARDRYSNHVSYAEYKLINIK